MSDRQRPSDPQCISRKGCIAREQCRAAGCCMRPTVGAYRDATGELVIPSEHIQPGAKRPETSNTSNDLTEIDGEKFNLPAIFKRIGDLESDCYGGSERNFVAIVRRLIVSLVNERMNLLKRLSDETGEQLLWTLEWRASFDGPWTPYYALYPTRAKARAAIMNARGEASDWRTVPLQRVPDPEAPPSKADEQQGESREEFERDRGFVKR